jgi:glutathione S-transferase
MLIVSITLTGLLIWFLWERNQRKTRAMTGGIHTDITLPHSQEYELYHNDLSLCSKKVRACLAELDIDYKAHHIDLIETGSYETLSRHYLAVNPSGTVPALVHCGHPIYESHDIIAYVAEKNAAAGRQALVPVADNAKILMQYWVDKASMKGDDPAQGLANSAANCAALLTIPLFSAGIKAIPTYRIFEGLLFHRLRSRAALFLFLKARGLAGITRVPRFMTALGAARESMHKHLDELNTHLATGGPYICGNAISLADISWLAILERLVEADWIDVFLGGGRRPWVQAYWQRLQETPAYRIGILNYQHPSVATATAMIRTQKARDPQFKAALEGS